MAIVGKTDLMTVLSAVLKNHEDDIRDFGEFPSSEAGIGTAIELLRSAVVEATTQTEKNWAIMGAISCLVGYLTHHGTGAAPSTSGNTNSNGASN